VNQDTVLVNRYFFFVNQEKKAASLKNCSGTAAGCMGTEEFLPVAAVACAATGATTTGNKE
jgi:hypothetical protein